MRKLKTLILFGIFCFYCLDNLMSQKLQFSAQYIPSFTEEATSPGGLSLIQSSEFLSEYKTHSLYPRVSPSKLPLKSFALSYPFLPQFARENPAGHSYLCRMEVNVEKSLAVPLWIRAGKVQEWESYNSTAMYLQVKLLGFRR